MPFGLIGVPSIDQEADYVEHPVNGTGCAGLVGWTQHTQCVRDLMVVLDCTLRQVADAFSIRLSPFHDLVVYISEVPGVHNLRIKMLEQTEEHVEHHCRPSVAQMRR